MALLAGCAFDQSGIPYADRDSAIGPPDAAFRADAASAPDARPIDAAVDARPPPPDARPPFCPADPALVGCYRFDGDGTDQSLSGADADLTEVDWGAGVDGLAVVTDSESVIHVAEHPGLDATSLTLEMWVRAGSLPASTARAGLADNDGQYGLFVYGGGEVRCTGAGVVASYSPLALDTWTHIACTYDGASGWILYIDGAPRAVSAGNGPLYTGGGSGLSIAGNNPSGDPFTGAIDDLRLWSRVRSAPEICQDAGSC